MPRICVFAGSNPGVRPEYSRAACELGEALVARGYGAIYGGGSRGLMGALAEAVLKAGGEIIGVIPEGLFSREIAHPGLTHLYTVKSMHERKALMARLADSFIALPGGCGTFDELFEVITWNQIGIHHKPVGLLNAENYFTPLLNLVAHATSEGFVQPITMQQLYTASTSTALLDILDAQPQAQESTPMSDQRPPDP